LLIVPFPDPVLSSCPGHPADILVVTPQEPVVLFGGSTELNCSLACAGGKVEWRGLDTALGTISSFPTHSILHIRQATVATEGMKICQGSCHGQHYQKTVTLKVYALPDTLRLEAAPHILRPGHPAKLNCSAVHLYPITGVVLTWYRGHQAVNTDFDYEETDEELYNIVSTLSVNGAEVAEGVEFRCEVMLRVGQETFTRVASLGCCVFTAVMEQPVAVVTSTRSPSTARPVETTALSPGSSIPARDATTAQELDNGTTLDLAAVTIPPSTKHTVPWDLIAGSSTAHAATTTLPGSGTRVTVPTCSLQIWSLPPTGMRGRALRIECHAQCTGNATVGWLRTPAALSQYQQESTGSSSTLQLERAEPWHQGHYQCVLLSHRAQMVSLELLVSADSFSSSPAIVMGTAGSLLGLIVTGAVSRSLWKRFRS
ncbi:MADCA protein, partial [Pardalotus punctatus]|nr:MADCA protein [Pardalotus punctatus]